MSRIITYPANIDHIILLGGTPLLPKLAALLREQGYRVSAYTAPRQEAEIGPHPELAIMVTADINRDLDISTLTPTTLAIGLGEAWIFGEEIRTALGDRLIAYMSIPLPHYRGGAHISWAIMRGEPAWGGCLQLVTANTVPGEFDDGDLVARWRYAIPSHCRTPQDWFDETGDRDLRQILAFLAKLRQGLPVTTIPLDNTGSLFLPRLRTADNGWIDWSQSHAAVIRHIRAFDDPYPGAQTMLENRIVALKGVSEESLWGWPVPLQRGLVLSRVPDGLHIATMEGVMLARRVLSQGMDITDRVKVGMRFFTPTAVLDQALLTTPTYTPKA